MNKITASPSTSVAEFLRVAIASSGKTYEQIAAELGYESGSVIKMMAAGMTKLPVNRIKELAAALKIEPSDLFGRVLSDYFPELADLIDDLASPMKLTQGEKKLIATIRAQGEGAEPVVVDGRDIVAVVMV